MRRTVPVRAFLVALASAALVLTAACGSSDVPVVAGPATTGTAPSTGSEPTTAPTAGETSAPQAEKPQGTPETSASPAGKVITIAYANGKATGDTGRIKVKVGEPITLAFTSDVETEVHIHGADIHIQAAPGIEAVQEFTEAAPGIYEIELHDGGGVLARVQAQ